MVKVKFKDGQEFYYDGILTANLDLMKKAAKKDWDWVMVVDGVEGSGKSVFAQQIAKYCDDTLDLNRICFNPDEFKKAVVNAEKYQSIVYDEAYSGLNSRQTMTQTNRSIVAMLAEIRQKNLFVFIVLPTFFDLDKNVGIWRSRGLFHVNLGKNFERGYFKFYNYITKKYLYMKGKKLYDYTAKSAMPNFKGRFAKGYVVDEAEYRKKKVESLKKYEQDERMQKQLKNFKQQLVMNLYDIKDRMGLSQKDLGKIIGTTDRTIQHYLQEKREQNVLLKKELEQKPLENVGFANESAPKDSLTYKKSSNHDEEGA